MNAPGQDRGGSQERPPPRRGRPRHTDVERAVLLATLDELAARGFDRMSIDGIAARARVGKPSIYRRWPNKPTLAIAAIALLVDQEVPAPSGDLVTDLSRELHAAHRHLERSGSLPVIHSVLTGIEREDFFQSYREQLLQPRWTAIRQILEAAKENGQLPADTDTGTVSYLLFGLALAQYATGEPVPEDWAAPAVALLVNALRTLPAPGATGPAGSRLTSGERRVNERRV